MATYERFEDLPVWNTAITLAERIDDFITDSKDLMTWSKRDQIDRASLSVSNNIAEGFERGTTAELLSFLYIARGSTGEVRSMLCLFERRPKLRHLKSQISDLKSLAESCSRQIRAWAESLQNTEIRGQRHLNDRVRQQHKAASQALAFERKMMAGLPQDHPMRLNWEKRHGPSSD